ncbi:MAG: hypothetical protein D6729_14590, partial [Deltaproteobacteria bacterium]
WVQVRACARGFEAGGFRPARDAWRRFVQQAGSKGHCTRFRIHIGAAARGLRGRSFAAADDAVLVPAALWLPEPRSRPPRLSVEIEVARQGPIYLSVPFPEVGSVLRPRATLWRRPARSVFTRRPPLRLDLGDVRLEVVRVGPEIAAGDAAMERWLFDAVRATRTVFGRFPTRFAQVVVRVGPGRAPLFGMTHRGGGDGILLFVGRGCDREALARDWIAVHEMLHLGHPWMPAGDAWFFEGLATLYEPIARVRAGLLGEAEAWQRIVAGLARGARDGTGRVLREESAKMQETGAYRRVYWAGAAILLEAEIEAWKAGLGGLAPLIQTLPRCGRATAPVPFRRLPRCAAPEPLAQLLDRVARRHLDVAAFPDLGPTLERLGVTVDARGRVRLNGHAPDASIRTMLMHGAATGPMPDGRSEACPPVGRAVQDSVSIDRTSMDRGVTARPSSAKTTVNQNNREES